MEYYLSAVAFELGQRDTGIKTIHNKQLHFVIT